MSLPKCQHNVSADDGRFVGQWNGPHSRCDCCGVLFTYIDTVSAGSRGFESRTWQPKNRCGACGGEYADGKYTAPELRA